MLFLIFALHSDLVAVSLVFVKDSDECGEKRVRATI